MSDFEGDKEFGAGQVVASGDILSYRSRPGQVYRSGFTGGGAMGPRTTASTTCSNGAA